MISLIIIIIILFKVILKIRFIIKHTFLGITRKQLFIGFIFIRNLKQGKLYSVKIRFYCS